MHDLELETAILQIKGAQQNGFITFYNKTFHYVYTRAKYLFPSLMECREFIKQVYLSAFLHIAELTSGEDLEKWLSKRLLSCYHKLLVENGIEAFPGNAPKDVLSVSLSAGEDAPAGCMDKETCGRILQRQFKQLPVLPRILFLSFFHDGLSAAELSSLFECSESAILRELDRTKNVLLNAYGQAAPGNGQVLYPFNLKLVYYALELQNKKFVSTKEFAQLVWDSIASELTFKKAPKKKVLTLPLFCCFSALILAFILITMYAHGYFGNKTTSHKNQADVNKVYESTESNADTSDMGSNALPYSTDDLKPSSTTTIRDENGNVTTYDENGSEIPTPQSEINGSSANTGNSTNTDGSTNTDSSADTGSSSVNSTDNTGASRTDNSNTSGETKSSSGTASGTAPTVQTPSVTEPTVNTPSVTEPSVAEPSVKTPTPPDAPKNATGSANSTVTDKASGN